jgi:hypothetical protein
MELALIFGVVVVLVVVFWISAKQNQKNDPNKAKK